MDYQREDLKLRPGDKAWFLLADRNEWAEPSVVVITGDCDEGAGYEATCSDRVTAEDSEGCIHTCNGFLTANRKVLRAELLRRARETRKKHAAIQADASRWVRFLDYVIFMKGKF